MNIQKNFSKEFLWVVCILFVLITNIMAPVVAYLVFQIRALIKLRGGRRIFAAVPLLFMIPILVVSIEDLLKGSNLWPIFLILASPVGCVWLLIAFRYGHDAKQKL
jgi:uncharacterized protein YebE (UPF0316 family)